MALPKRLTKGLLLWTTAVLLYICCHLPVLQVEATGLSGITSDTIEAKKQEISNAEAEQQNIKNSITDIEQTIASLEQQKENVNEYIKNIDATMSDLQDKIKGYEKLITEKKAELTQREQELEAAQTQEAEQYDSMCQHIQYLYEQGEYSYLEAVLTADSFADMMNRAEYIEEIAAYDDRMLQMYILQREYIALCKQSVEEEMAALEESEQALEAEKGNLETVRQQKAKDLAAYEADISLTEATLKELEADLEYQTSLISQLEKEITEEQKKILEEQNITLDYDGGLFAWPAPSYTVITSEFGWRTDPFTGLSAYHNGLDMAAASGTPIVAAYDGIVIAATWNNSMGNYVMIDHGNGLYTIYMHASELYVSANDVVIKGEQIAAVGTTGRSTGPHLHFSVRLNGAYVSPWDYLK